MEKSTIVVISSNTLMSELLAYTLRNEMQISCVSASDPQQLENLLADCAGGSSLLLHDASREDLNELLAASQTLLSGGGFPAAAAALFNLDHDVTVERQALRYGVRGFFYRNESLANMLKGIRMLLTGEMWIPRSVLFKLALNESPVQGNGSMTKSRLTHREIDVLMNLSAGATNEEIAEKLFISSHTVKAHLYNIYQKINVDNRFQAALWAAKNL